MTRAYVWLTQLFASLHDQEGQVILYFVIVFMVITAFETSLLLLFVAPPLLLNL